MMNLSWESGCYCIYCYFDHFGNALFVVLATQMLLLVLKYLQQLFTQEASCCYGACYSDVAPDLHLGEERVLGN